MKEENFFYQHRKEIRQVAIEQNVPIDVASDIWFAQQQKSVPVSVRKEWDEICQSYLKNPNKLLRDLFEE